MRLFVFVQFSFENPGPELQQQAAESPGVSLSGFHVLVALRKSIAVQVFAQKKKTKKTYKLLWLLIPCVCVSVIYTVHTHTLSSHWSGSTKARCWLERKKKKKKKTSESRKSLLTYFFSREREKVMKNMEGKRKSLPFMLRLIIEGRTSLWVLHGGEGRRGQNIRNVPRCPYKIKVNYMKTSSKSYRSVCNCIRFSPYGIHRLKHHRLKKWNQNQKDCFCWTNALLSFHFTDRRETSCQLKIITF